MARRPNYAFEKRQKELQKKAKKEARLAKKAARRAEAEANLPQGAGGEEEAAVESDSEA
ncbi:MAG: hypothetical protein JRJ84_19375 [Deltaproteobacteria bacterium]|nr:hypothetical protein [Deltaproteobacteria bacterium]